MRDCGSSDGIWNTITGASVTDWQRGLVGRERFELNDDLARLRLEQRDLEHNDRGERDGLAEGLGGPRVH